MLALTAAGCHPTTAIHSPVDPKANTLKLGPRVLVGERADRIEAAGATDAREVLATFGAEGQHVGTFVEVPAGGCTLIVAAGGESVGDIDLFAFDDGGRRLGADESPSRQAAIIICPEQTTRAYLAAQVAAGTGMVGLMTWRVSTDKEEAVAKAAEVRGRPGEDTGRLSAWPGLETALRERADAFGGDWHEVHRAALPLSGARPSIATWDVPAGACVDLLIVPSEDARLGDLVAENASGAVIGRSAAPGRTRSLVVCSHDVSKVTFTLRTAFGRGVAALVIRQSPRGEAERRAGQAHFAGAALSIEAAVADETARLRKVGESIGAPVAGFRRKVATGHTLSESFSLEAGCHRLALLTSRPMAGVNVTLWDEAGHRLQSLYGSSRAVTFACVAAKTTVILEVSPIALGGDVALIHHHDETPAAVAAQAPLASGNMLAWLESNRGPGLKGRLEGAVVSGRTGATRLNVSAAVCASRSKANDAMLLIAASSDDRGVVARETEGGAVVGRQAIATAAAVRCPSKTRKLSIEAGAASDSIMMLPLVD